jgi:hypothetical protein
LKIGAQRRVNLYQNNKMDTLGEILWYLVFLTPLITIPWALRIPDTSLIFRVVIGFRLCT